MLTKAARWLTSGLRDERGQTLIVIVGVLAVLMGFTALVVDVGFWLGDRRTAQNQADAVALAAAAVLPDEDDAGAAAQNWATLNALPPDDQLICCEFDDKNGDGDFDWVKVRVERQSGIFFSRFLGVFEVDIGVSAAAAQLQVVGSCVMPWAIQAPNSDPDADYGLDRHMVYIFQDSDFTTPGNFGALAFYGQGDVNYRNTILGNACTEDGVTACGSEDTIITQGDTLDCATQTGALGATTHHALKERYPATTWTPCDVQTEETDTNGNTIPDGWEEAIAKSLLAECQDRAVPLSIINAFPEQGQSAEVEIYGLVTFYIAGWDRDPPYGNGDTDGDPAGGMVWGYLIPFTADPIWLVELGASPNPFAAIVVALVE